MNVAPLTTLDVLSAFDRWNGGNPGPAYGRVVLYAAGRISLEELTRAVLADQGINPDRWGEYVCVVCRAFDRWMAMGFARTPLELLEPCADCIGWAA